MCFSMVVFSSDQLPPHDLRHGQVATSLRGASQQLVVIHLAIYQRFAVSPVTIGDWATAGLTLECRTACRSGKRRTLPTLFSCILFFHMRRFSCILFLRYVKSINGVPPRNVFSVNNGYDWMGIYLFLLLL